MTHKDLVKLGVNYLLNAKKCNPVFAERGSANISEVPDVIGWTSRECIIIECKASRADYLADRKKPSRKDNKGLGSRRYYLLTKDVYDVIVCSKFTDCGWGILVATESASGVKSVRQVTCKGSVVFKSNIKAERDFLRSRIMQIQRFGKE